MGRFVRFVPGFSVRASPWGLAAASVTSAPGAAARRAEAVSSARQGQSEEGSQSRRCRVEGPGPVIDKKDEHSIVGSKATLPGRTKADPWTSKVPRFRSEGPIWGGARRHLKAPRSCCCFLRFVCERLYGDQEKKAG